METLFQLAQFERSGSFTYKAWIVNCARSCESSLFMLPLTTTLAAAQKSLRGNKSEIELKFEKALSIAIGWSLTQPYSGRVSTDGNIHNHFR